MRAPTFKRWAAFSDTLQAYREWQIKGAVPGLDVRAGDLLLEVGPDVDHEVWDGLRFQVRRPPEKKKGKNRVVTELEEWQAAQLFGGEVPPWPPEGRALDSVRAALVESDADLTVLGMIAGVVADQIGWAKDRAAEAPKAPAHPALAVLKDHCPHFGRWRLTQDLPGRLRRDDIILHSWGRPETEAAVPFELKREELEALRAEAATAETLSGGRALENSRLLNDRRSWGLNAKNWRSNWWAVRPVRPGHAREIEASSDTAALFELVHEAGGRLPAEDEDR